MSARAQSFGRDDGRLENHFEDKYPPLSPSEAAFEAARCLYCFDAPCIKSCPTAIDIPTFIRKIATGNLRGSARTILRSNLLGASCARVCPVEVLCESTCVYLEQDREPIPIGRLQRHAMDLGASPDLLTKREPTGRSVALVGAGPASLACAGTLALLGHRAVLFERESLAGGLNVSGVAPYKLRVDGALREVEFIERLGVEIRTRTTVGKDVTAEQLLDDYDAVFLGPGLGGDSHLGIEGEDGPGVIGATHWIRGMKTDPGHKLDGVRRAVVIGGGNTAIDVARELKALGIHTVSMAYRRRRGAMSAYDHEVKPGLDEGVALIEEAAVAEIVRDHGRVTGVRVVDTDDGVPTDRTRAVFPTDLVVVAIGQAKLRALAEQFDGVTCDDRGRIVVDPDTFATGNPRVFAGGDAVNGGKEVVNAAHDGQAAARAIDAMLRGEQDA
ncbi:MAG: FAD-dependent oxidoreductase [Planctomycetes bacterium]|nr:FAD-dependent oxidoreductase [Planctomycetota bacterium]